MGIWSHNGQIPPTMPDTDCRLHPGSALSEEQPWVREESAHSSSGLFQRQTGVWLKESVGIINYPQKRKKGKLGSL